MTPQFTVCCLLYGDYPQLAERLLQSLCRPGWFEWFYLRIAYNNLSQKSADVLLKWADKLAPVLDICLPGVEPFYKYPVMRKLFAAKLLDTPYTMWFDDDSHILPSAPAGWFSDIVRIMADYAMIGAPYYKHPEGNQEQFWKAQPWHTGRPLAYDRRAGKNKVDFITGGWWTIKTDILQQHDWPLQQLEHNGGDVILGALLRQQSCNIGRFTQHLGINCDASGKCSSAPRRGFFQRPLGYNYQVEPQSVPEVAADPLLPDWRTLIG